MPLHCRLLRGSSGNMRGHSVLSVFLLLLSAATAQDSGKCIHATLCCKLHKSKVFDSGWSVDGHAHGRVRQNNYCRQASLYLSFNNKLSLRLESCSCLKLIHVDLRHSSVNVQTLN